jgi:cytochrome oxidase Cu insertion factor (SCO1/SenC/PrrC family)
MYVGPQKCQQTCHDTLYHLKQIHTALGKNTSRLQRLFIAHPNCQKSVCEQYLGENYPDMKKVRMTLKDFDTLLGAHSNAEVKEMVGEIYVIDPQGNIMMHYSADMEARFILSDVKKLLRASKIG